MSRKKRSQQIMKSSKCLWLSSREPECNSWDTSCLGLNAIARWVAQRPACGPIFPNHHQHKTGMLRLLSPRRQKKKEHVEMNININSELFSFSRSIILLCLLCLKIDLGSSICSRCGRKSNPISHVIIHFAVVHAPE